MATTVTESIVVRRPAAVVAAIVTDPGVLLPHVAGLGRFAFIAHRDDGTELWDMFIDIGAIHVGGRVVVTSDERTLSWEAIRGTRHRTVVEVTDHEAGCEVSMAMTVDLAGALLGRAAELLARGIARRHLVAGLEQVRHHAEFELPTA